MPDFHQAALPLRPSLYGAAMRLTRDPDVAADLVQDVMVRAFRFWGSFKAGSNLDAWMFTILRNTFKTGYNRRARSRTFANELAVEVRSHGSVAAIAYSDSQPPGPEDAHIASRTVMTVRAAIAELPEDYRQAVELADLEGLEYKEIAKVMDCPIGTVMSRLHRGRKALRGLLCEHAVELGIVDAREGGGS